MHHDTSNISREYYHKDVLNIFPSLKGRTLISWIEKGLITPLHEPENRGGKRIYSYHNLIQIAIIHELSMYSFPLKSIKRENKVLDQCKQNNYENFLIICFYPAFTINKMSKKRVAESRMSLTWAVEPIEDFKISEKTTLSSAVVLNVRQLKQVVDDAL